MKQITIRGLEAPLERRLRGLARERGISLNRAALILMRRGAGLDDAVGSSTGVGDSLDHLIGKWSREESDGILRAVEVFEEVEEDLWSS